MGDFLTIQSIKRTQLKITDKIKNIESAKKVNNHPKLYDKIDLKTLVNKQ